MLLDWNTLLYDPAFAAFGVPAMLTYTAGVVEITVIDDTRAKSNTSGQLEMHDVGPGAFARMPELINKGIALKDCEALGFNNQTWLIRFGELRGSPNGEDQGEVRFFLKASE
jgi:hypothetical protein